MSYQLFYDAGALYNELKSKGIILHEQDARDIDGVLYISKIENRNSYIFIVLEQPDYNKEKKEFSIKEVNCILTPKTLYIYNPHKARYIDQFFQENPASHYTLQSPTKVLVRLIAFCTAQMYRSIAKFRNELHDVQDCVLEKMHAGDSILAIQNIKRNLIVFNSIIMPLRSMYDELQKTHTIAENAEARQLLVDCTQKIETIALAIENFTLQSDVIIQTNESLMARTTNKRLGSLTVINSLLLLPPIVLEVWRVLNSGELHLWSLVAAFGVIAIISCIIVGLLKKLKLI